MSDSIESFKEKYKILEDLPGMGPAMVSKLKEIGFKTVESLGTATVNELVSAGIGKEVAKKLINAASKTTAITFVRGDELVELRKNVRRLSTGCSSLDDLLGHRRPRLGAEVVRLLHHQHERWDGALPPRNVQPSDQGRHAPATGRYDWKSPISQHKGFYWLLAPILGSVLMK